MSLSGQVCMIVGASGAIGAAVARRFASAQASLALTYHSSEPRTVCSDLQHSGATVETYSLDVRSLVEVSDVTAKVESDLGPISVLINCSGMYGPIGPTYAVAADAWSAAIHLNLIGAFNLIRHVVPGMVARRSGRIIHFSGGGAAYARPFFTAYSASKTALVRFTESLGEELREFNIQVNAIAPGPVKSRLWEELRANVKSAGSAAEAELKKMDETGGVSAGRAAELAYVLATMKSFVTGRLISAIHDDWEHLDDYAEKLTDSDTWTLRRVSIRE